MIRWIREWFIISTLFIMGAGMLVVFWAIRTIPERRWRIFFVSFTIMAFVEYGLVFLISLGLAGAALLRYVPVIEWSFRLMWLPLVLPLTVAVRDDRRLGCRRPWTHWLGIGLLVCNWILAVIPW